MKGILLFAFNNGEVDYVDMAVKTAKRANHFLNLPVTLVTDIQSSNSIKNYNFDNIIFTDAQTSNKKNKITWINKGRYKAYELTPYKETLVIDTDYLINSDKLNHIVCEDYACHKNTMYLMNPDMPQEKVGASNLQTLWATVILFKKTMAAEAMFHCLQMVQENYGHYMNLYGMYTGLYRNDYGITIANDIVNNHVENSENIIPWELTHLQEHLSVYKNTTDEFNTQYTIVDTTKKRPEYLVVKDFDFHCLNKQTFMDIV